MDRIQFGTNPDLKLYEHITHVSTVYNIEYLIDYYVLNRINQVLLVMQWSPTILFH